jgi:hypothetical protein
VSIGRYYGVKRGAVVKWHGARVAELTIGEVDRTIPEGATWTLRFTPRRVVTGNTRRELAHQLHRMAIDYKAKGQPCSAYAYMDKIDALLEEAQP